MSETREQLVWRSLAWSSFQTAMVDGRKRRTSRSTATRTPSLTLGYLGLGAHSFDFDVHHGYYTFIDPSKLCIYL